MPHVVLVCRSACSSVVVVCVCVCACACACAYVMCVFCWNALPCILVYVVYCSLQNLHYLIMSAQKQCSNMQISNKCDMLLWSLWTRTLLLHNASYQSFHDVPKTITDLIHVDVNVNTQFDQLITRYHVKITCRMPHQESLKDGIHILLLDFCLNCQRWVHTCMCRGAIQLYIHCVN